jgi:hypothetical protein
LPLKTASVLTLHTAMSISPSQYRAISSAETRGTLAR